MYIPLNDILFLLMLLIFLTVVYHRILNNIDIFRPFKEKYSTFDRNLRIKNYINQITKKPKDSQKVVFKETFFLMTVFFIMYLLSTKALFFTAVVSGSMVPTFYRDDLVLMQNIDQRYNVGDIIMFIPPDLANPYTHRITGITEKGIKTKGDAISTGDWWELKEEDISGKAVIFQGKPIVIKGYGKFFIIDDTHQDFGPFGQDYRKYQLFFQVVKLYGYIIVVISILLYIVLTARQKPWQSR